MGRATVEAALSTGPASTPTDSAFESSVTQWGRVSASRFPYYRLVARFARSLCIYCRISTSIHHRTSDLPDTQERASASATAGDHPKLQRTGVAIGSVQLSLGAHLGSILPGHHDGHYLWRPLLNPLWVGMRCWAVTGFIGRAFPGRHRCGRNDG